MNGVEAIMYVAMDCTGLIILFLMIINFGSSNVKRKDFDDILFVFMLYTNAVLLVLDAVAWLIDGSSFPGARVVNLTVTSVYYFLHPVICMAWLMYCEYKLTEDIKKINHRLPIYLTPTIAIFVMIIYSYYNPGIFIIADDNCYSRGPLYVPFVLLCFTYYAYSIFTIRISGRKNTNPNMSDKQKFLMSYPLIPFVCSIIQSCLYGISIIWVSSAIALLILYFNLQSALISTDILTGLNNRRRFQQYLDSKLHNPAKRPLVFMLMIDVDRFKSINDQYGHLMGDEALQQTADVLKRSAFRSDFIARIGGDEFVVVGDREAEGAIIETIDFISREVGKFNDARKYPFRLSLSVGYSFVTLGSQKTADEITAEADKMMYQNKQERSKPR